MRLTVSVRRILLKGYIFIGSKRGDIFKNFVLGSTVSTWQRRRKIAKRIASKKCLAFLGPLNEWLQPRSLFCIKKGYHHSTSVLNFDDTPNKDEWQKEVYLLAKAIMAERNYQTVIDLGCGSAFKLIHYLGDHKTMGIEVEKTCDWLKKNYPDRDWQRFDKTNPSNLETDLLICSDVIEHIQNPDSLLDYIKAIDFKCMVISTPEREGIAGNKDFGPPENPFHYREWDASEFKNYISQYFDIEEQRIFSANTETQVIICKKRTL